MKKIKKLLTINQSNKPNTANVEIIFLSAPCINEFSNVKSSGLSSNLHVLKPSFLDHEYL